MSRDQILSLLRKDAERIHARFAVRRLALFGSAARDALREGSDIDLLVEFDGPATFESYMDLKFHLEDLLGRAVDLVSVKGLMEELRSQVEKDAVRVA